MNLSKLLKGFMGQKQSASPAPRPAPQNYNLSENYYPKEAFDTPKQPQTQASATQFVPNFAPDSSPMQQVTQQQAPASGGGLDIQSLLPLLAGMNSGGGSGLNIASLLGGNKSGASSGNPLSLVSSILGNNKKDDKDVDLNKNSKQSIESFKKISDLDD